jgi:hypothetical protein
MKVIFLDFDGVLNSAASFMAETRKKRKLAETDPEAAKAYRVNETLCSTCTSNFQRILDKCPDAKIVLSTTWRNLYEMDWLKAKLASYNIDSSRVIGKTPAMFNRLRGTEIADWLEDHPEVTHYVILDDNSDMLDSQSDKFVQTSWMQGLTLEHTTKAIEILEGEDTWGDIPF